ncbi:hypothetical protein [Streptomyces bullii]|uniref:Uncharacterized protein n=1 Tax=Streptomyces bullii TaxID=349910 RepID=A0ABW0UU36_9ACTN
MRAAVRSRNADGESTAGTVLGSDRLKGIGQGTGGVITTPLFVGSNTLHPPSVMPGCSRPSARRSHSAAGPLILAWNVMYRTLGQALSKVVGGFFLRTA